MLRAILRKTGSFLIALSRKEAFSEKRQAGSATDKNHFGRQARYIASRLGPKKNALLAGSIQLLQLDQIKREIGPGWDRAAEGAYKIIEDTIVRNLWIDDTYARHGEETFILCFATTDRESVEARMRKIVDEIKVALSAHGNTAYHVAHDVADIEFANVEEESILDTIANSLRRVRQEADQAAKTWRQHLLRMASIRYVPVWAAKKHVIALHRAVLDEETGEKTVQRLRTLSSIEELRGVLFELDCLLLARATTGLHELIGNGGRTQLIVPLNFNSMNVRGRREEYLKLCESIPAGYRRFLLFQIRDIPIGTPAGRILDFAVPLNGYARGLLIEATSASTELGEASRSAILGLAAYADQFGSNFSEATPKLTRFVRALETHDLKSFLHGVEDHLLARAAVSAGVDYMDGPVIAKPIRELRNFYSWNLAQ